MSIQFASADKAPAPKRPSKAKAKPVNSMPRQTDLEEFTGKTVDLFSYAALSRDEEASAREDAALIRSHIEDISSKGVEIGQALIRQQTRLAGSFEAWVRDECLLSRSTAFRFMKVARDLGKKVPTLGLSRSLGASALELLISDTTPQEVRDTVENLLVDGRKVTVADIRRMKAEAKSAEDRASEAQQTVETLAARNAELVVAIQAPAAPPELDLDAIRAEGAKEAEARLNTRINDLADANVKANDEAKVLRSEIEKLKTMSVPPAAAMTNVVKPAFGADQATDPETDEEIDEEGSISAFSGALGSMDGLDFSATAFWKQQGKTGTHGKRIHKALLAVNATIGLLIKEYAK